MRPVTAGRVGWVVMPGKEFWPLLCHPCSLMSSSRKQKDSPTEKKCDNGRAGTGSMNGLFTVFIPDVKKEKAFFDWAGRAQHSSPLHICDSSAMDAHWGSEEKSYCSREATSKCSPAPSTGLPNTSFEPSPFGGAPPRAQDLFKQWQGVKHWAPQGSLTPLQGAANSDTLCGCGNRVIRALRTPQSW